MNNELLKISNTFVLAALKMANIKPIKSETSLGRYYEIFDKDVASPIIKQFEMSPFAEYAKCVQAMQSMIWKVNHKGNHEK